MRLSSRMNSRATFLMINDIEQLLKQASPADPRVSQIMVAQYYDSIYRLALSILNDPDDADDATQTTFIHAYQSLSRYTPGASFRSWLFTIAINASRDLLRRRRTRQTLQGVIESIFHLGNYPPSPEEVALQNEHRRELWQAVQSLDEKHRLPVLLRYVHDLPVREIASILNIREGTVHSRLHYAARKLQARLAGLAQYNGEAP